MPNRLGTDLNANQPTDSDYARHTSVSKTTGAKVLQDLKARIKAFFGVLFDLETGDLKDDVVRSASLVSLIPDPTGKYREVTVNKKGQVLEGSTGVIETGPQPYRAIFYGDPTKTAWQENDEGIENIPLLRREVYRPPGSVTSESSRVYRFQVPEKVTRMWTKLYPCYIVPPATEDATLVSTFPVTPGMELLIYCGDGVDGAAAPKVKLSNGHYVAYQNDPSWTERGIKSVDIYKNDHTWESPRMSMVILEWFASTTRQGQPGLNGGFLWVPTATFNGPTRHWMAAAVSYDGNKMFLGGVLEQGEVLRSLDGGDNFATTTSAPASWLALCGTADLSSGYGVIRDDYAAPTIGGLMQTTDSGASWNFVDPSGTSDFLLDVCCSQDGLYVITCSAADTYISPDYGASWVPVSVVGTCCCCSDDGQYIYVVNGATLNRSSDGWGSTGTTTLPSGANAKSIACSQDGLIVVVADQQNLIYKSLDGGVTFTTLSGSPSALYEDISISGDGNRILLAAQDHLYLSEDGGLTWVDQIHLVGKLFAVGILPKQGGRSLAAVFSGQAYVGIPN